MALHGHTSRKSRFTKARVATAVTRARTRGRVGLGRGVANVRTGAATPLATAPPNDYVAQLLGPGSTRTKLDAGQRFRKYLSGIVNPDLGVSAAGTAGVAPSRRGSAFSPETEFLRNARQAGKQDFLSSLGGGQAQERLRLTRNNAVAVAGMPRSLRQLGIGGMGASDAVVGSRPSPFAASQAGLGARSLSVIREEAEQRKHKSFMDLIRQSSAPATATPQERQVLANQRQLTPGMRALLGDKAARVGPQLAGQHELGGPLAFAEWTAAKKQRGEDLDAGIVANDVAGWWGPGKSPGERGPNNLQRREALLAGMDDEQREKWDAFQERLSPKSFANSVINRRRIARAGGQPMTQDQAERDERFARGEETDDDLRTRAQKQGRLPELLQEKQWGMEQQLAVEQRESTERAGQLNFLSGIIGAEGSTPGQRLGAWKQSQPLLGGRQGALGQPSGQDDSLASATAAGDMEVEAQLNAAVAKARAGDWETAAEEAATVMRVSGVSRDKAVAFLRGLARGSGVDIQKITLDNPTGGVQMPSLEDIFGTFRGTLPGQPFG